MPARHPVKHIFIAIKLAYFFTILFGVVRRVLGLTIVWHGEDCHDKVGIGTCNKAVTFPKIGGQECVLARSSL